MSKKKQPWYPPPSLPCTGVESHAHLEGNRFTDDFLDVIERAKNAGVSRIGQLFLHPQVYREQRERFAHHPEFFFIMGIHPTDLNEHEISVLGEVQQLIATDPLIKAVGEIGLDYFWKECSPEQQKHFLVQQLAMAKELQKPVVIHCREAEADCFEVLEAEGMHGYPLLWHCFGGGVAMAKKILDAGWHISIPGPVTYPKNTELREAVAYIPADRLLVETDSPYLAPVPHRGQRNEPAFLGYTIQVMADARKVSVEELWTTCGENARRFFGLDG